MMSEFHNECDNGIRPILIEHITYPDSGYIDFYSSDADTINGVKNPPYLPSGFSKASPLSSKGICPSPPTDGERLPLVNTIPADFATDFTPPNTIKLNTYSLINLLDEPMRWYINDHLGFSHYTFPTEPTLNELTIGLFMHKMIETVVYKLNKHGENKRSPSVGEDGNRPETVGTAFMPSEKKVSLGDFKQCLTEDFLYGVFHDLAYGHYLTVFPHNFTSDYFRDVLLPFAISRLQDFFCTGELSGVSDDSTLKAELSPPEKLLLDTPDYKVFIAGRVDMVIRDPHSNISYIIDFKTGHSDTIQLVIYNWLLGDAHENYKLYFFNLFSTEDTTPATSTKITIDTICENLRTVLDKCKTDGYYACKDSKYGYGFEEISRS